MDPPVVGLQGEAGNALRRNPAQSNSRKREREREERLAAADRVGKCLAELEGAGALKTRVGVGGEIFRENAVAAPQDGRGAQPVSDAGSGHKIGRFGIKDRLSRYDLD